MKPAKIVKTVREGSMRIDLREYADGRYGFDWTAPGDERRKVRLHELAAVERKAREMLGVTHAGKIDLLSIDPREFAEFLLWKATRRKPIMVPNLVESFLASKADKGRSEWTIESLQGILESFAKTFQKPITDLTREEVERWLSAVPRGAKRWNNMLGAVIGLHNFARRNRLIGADILPAESIDRKTVTRNILTFSPEEMATLIESVDPEWLPSVVLGAFCGVRPEESCPDPFVSKPCLRWENFLWDRAKIDMPEAVSKVRRRRPVPICDAAMEFLRPFRKCTGRISPERMISARYRHWAKWSGVAWKRNALRHSYASYRLAILMDVPALAIEMGTSVKMIFDNYLDQKHADEAQRWFAIRPSESVLKRCTEWVANRMMELHGTKVTSKPVEISAGEGT